MDIPLLIQILLKVALWSRITFKALILNIYTNFNMIFMNKLYFVKEFDQIGFSSYKITLMYFIYITYINYYANITDYFSN